MLRVSPRLDMSARLLSPPCFVVSWALPDLLKVFGPLIGFVLFFFFLLFLRPVVCFAFALPAFSLCVCVRSVSVSVSRAVFGLGLVWSGGTGQTGQAQARGHWDTGSSRALYGAAIYFSILLFVCAVELYTSMAHGIMGNMAGWFLLGSVRRSLGWHGWTRLVLLRGLGMNGLCVAT